MLDCATEAHLGNIFVELLNFCFSISSFRVHFTCIACFTIVRGQVRQAKIHQLLQHLELRFVELKCLALFCLAVKDVERDVIGLRITAIPQCHFLRISILSATRRAWYWHPKLVIKFTAWLRSIKSDRVVCHDFTTTPKATWLYINELIGIKIVSLSQNIVKLNDSLHAAIFSNVWL